MIIQLNDADPRVFHLIPKLAVILTLSFIQKTKNQKNDWKLCQPLLHNQGVSLVGYLKSGAPNDNFRKNICSEYDLRSRVFETFVVKFLACLPLLGFSNIQKMVYLPIFYGFLP